MFNLVEACERRQFHWIIKMFIENIRRGIFFRLGMKPVRSISSSIVVSKLVQQTIRCAKVWRELAAGDTGLEDKYFAQNAAQKNFGVLIP